MKWLIVFAVVAVLQVVNSAASGKSQFGCPVKPVNVQCFVEPCSVNPCGDNEVCCNDYSRGCDRICLGCPTFPSNVQCFVSPCSVSPCADNEICCEDYSIGCNRHCYPK